MKKSDEGVEKDNFSELDWSEFPNGEIPAEIIGKKVLILALDTEYQTNFTSNTNLCLSYQYSCYDVQSGKLRSGIFYMDINKNRD